MERMPELPSSSRLREVLFIGLGLVVYTILSFVKMHNYSATGRFWAEEGTAFVRHIYGKGFFESLMFLHQGRLELWTNLTVYLSSLVDFQHAPLVTTYLSFLIQTLPILFLLGYRRKIALSGPLAILWIVLLAGLTQSNEVWANSINLHFHFALLAALIAIFPVQTGWHRHISRVFLVAAGLSGIPPNFLVPVFAVVALIERSKERWIQLALICTTMLLQAYLLLFVSGFTTASRPVNFDLWVFLLAFFNQTFFSILAGVDISNHLSQILYHLTYELEFEGIIFLGLFLFPLIYLIKLMVKHGNWIEYKLVFIGIFLAFLNFGFALGYDRTPFMIGGGPRYWYVSNAIFLLFLISFLVRKRVVGGKVILFFIFLSSMHAIHSDRYSGPNWVESYTAAKANNETVVSIWPRGWKMRIPAGEMD